MGSVNIPGGAGSGASPVVLMMLLAGMIFVPIIFGFAYGGKLRKRIEMIWACGLEKVNPRMQYTATGFSKPIRMIFSNIYRASHEIEISKESSAYFKSRIRYELKTESIFQKYLYEPLSNTLITVAHILRRIQTGRVQTYLAYIFITLILLLLFAR